VVSLQAALLMLAQALAVSLVLAAGYVFGAWVLGIKLGAWSLMPWWLLVATTVSAVVLHRAHVASDPQSGRAQLQFSVGFVAMFFLAFGFSTLVVWRRCRRRTADSLTLGVLAGGIGAFYAGFAVALFVYFVLDVRRVLAG